MKLLAPLLLLALVPLTLSTLVSPTQQRAFSRNEFRARYQLMVQYKHGLVASCPDIIEYAGEPVESGDDLFLRHLDMAISIHDTTTDPDACTDAGSLRVTRSDYLTGGRLTSFLSSIRGSIDKTRLFASLQQVLVGRRYYISLSDSARICGANRWFFNDETFFFFDESTESDISIVKKVFNGQPEMFSIPLLGNIRYMIAVRTGTTCIYRVESDVDKIRDNISRPSDSPSATPKPSTSSTSSASPSASMTPSVKATTSVTPSVSSSPSPEASTAPSLSPTASTSASPSVAATSTSTPQASASASASTTTSPTSTSTPRASASASTSTTASPTSTKTPQASASASTSTLASPTSTSTPRASASASASTTTSPASTSTPRASVSASASTTTSPTSTSTPRASASASASTTTSPTSTSTPRASVSASASTAASPTSTSTPRASVSPSASTTNSPTSTSTPRASASATSSTTTSPTSTSTPKASASASASTTNSPTSTSTPQASASASSSTTSSPSPSKTAVTLSSVPSTTPTPSPTRASTQTPSPSLASTPSPSLPSSPSPLPQNVTLASASPTPSKSANGRPPGQNLGGGDRENGDIDGTSACFPSSARVQTSGGGEKQMKDVALGDMIWTGGGYERVLLWTHADAGAYTRFLRIGTRNASLALSPGHLLYVNGVLQAAGHVRAGDRVMWMQGQMGGFVETEVVSVKSVWEKGLYNPHTASGELVVDGVRTSCYTLALHSQTAHALLAPLRVLAHAMTFERTGRMVGAAIGRQVEMLGQGGYGCSV